MNKWHLHFLRLAYFGLAAILPIYALADYNATQGAGTIFRAFDGTHGGTALCAAANTQCQAIGLVNSAGAEIGTAGAPVRFDPTGTTTQPVSGTVTANAGTNLNTSALATSALQGTNTATTAHTCSVAGFSELGCLGQIDDDIKAPIPAGTARIGYASDDVCTQKAKTNLPISQNGTASVQLIALSGATVIYVCSLSLIAAGATTVAITTGTGAACVTGTVAVIGSTTVANSMSLAANGGLTLGSGAGTIAQGAASSELCMVLGTNVFVAGNLTFVQQ